MIWVEFGLRATLIVVAATVLSRYSDVLAEKTGLRMARSSNIGDRPTGLLC